jgi:hypothetical protein
MSQAPLACVTLARALDRWLSAPRPKAATAGAARPASPAAPGPDALEDEAYEALEVVGRLGTSEDEEWKPFRIEIAIRNGWHVNANPAGTGLVPVAVASLVGRLRAVRYPPAEAWDGGAGPVPVHRGRITVEGEIERPGGGAAAVELSYQACDESRCLPPVTRVVRLR